VADCEALARQTLEAFGRIDGLVNSAYVHGEWATADTADPSGWAAVYDVNCLGALRMAQAALDGLRKAGGGAIVNVSTMSAVKPFAGEAAYAASKGALAALTRHMARDLGPYGVRVNCARLGWIGGASVYGWIDGQVAAGRAREAVEGEITARIPLGKIPPEEDCARAVLALVSDQMRVVTGATLDINGGEYMAP
jgi:NAD(P)-dependent dehydrogenase (short-subunit alcohol dehydrogenase family)